MGSPYAAHPYHCHPAHRRPRRRRRRHACPQGAHAVAPPRRTVLASPLASLHPAPGCAAASAAAAAVAALAASARDVAVLGGGGARSPAARARRATSLASATEGLLPPAPAIRCSTASTGASKKLYLLLFLSQLPASAGHLQVTCRSLASAGQVPASAGQVPASDLQVGCRIHPPWAAGFTRRIRLQH